MLAFANVMHLFPHKFASLRRRRFPGALVLRRGVTLSTAAVGMLLAGEAKACLLPRVLVDAIVKAALVFVTQPSAIAVTLTAPAVSLAEGMLQTMMFSKLSFISL